MICMNCGSQIEDDAVFCNFCGTKVNNVSQEPVAQPVVQQPVFEQPVVQQQPVFEQPVFEQPVVQQQPVFQQQTFQQQPAFQQQPEFQQFVTQLPAKQKLKSSKATVPAVIFAIISILASVMISIFGFMTNGKLGMGIANVVFAITAIFVVMYAISNTSVTAILKGVGILGTATVYIIFYGIGLFKSANTHVGGFFSDNKKATGTDFYFGILIYIMLLCFIVYALINLIKCFTNSATVSMAMGVCGYFAMLIMLTVFIISAISGFKGLLAFKFIPTSLGVITLILADIFASVSRAKKMEK